MGSYLIITDAAAPGGAPAGTAVNRIVADAGFAPGAGYSLIVDDGRELWSPASAVRPPNYEIRTLAWRRRLTDAEIGGFTLAASRGLEQGDPTLQVFLDDLGRATAVDLQEANFLAGLDAAVQMGLIAADRIPMLTAPGLPEELP